MRGKGYVMLVEDWLRGCVHHDGRHGEVTLPCDRVLAIADYIESTRSKVEVVRCKDCKHKHLNGMLDGIVRKCPFCGGEARLIQKSHGSQNSPTRITNSYVVGCEKCRIYTEYYQSDIWQGTDGVVNIDANGAIDAIEAWNKRVGEQDDES